MTAFLILATLAAFGLAGWLGLRAARERLTREFEGMTLL